LNDRVAWGLALAGLEDRRNHRVSTFSGGMKRRLNLAAALVHRPAVVLMDEPTVGVDPQSRNHIFDTIQQLSRDGLTIIYTTHYMEEAQRLCDRVAIMDRGRIMALDSVSGLLRAHGGRAVVSGELVREPPPRTTLPGQRVGTTLRFESDRPLAELNQLAAAGIEFASVQIAQSDLESVFLALTGRALRDE
jgi:ABC-2 type transport system ATP-binding protein